MTITVFPKLTRHRPFFCSSHLLIYTHILGYMAADLKILEISLCKLDDTFKLENLKDTMILKGLFQVMKLELVNE